MSQNNNPSPSEKNFPPIPWGLNDDVLGENDEENGLSDDHDEDYTEDDYYIGSSYYGRPSDRKSLEQYRQRKRVLIYRKRSLRKRLRQLWIEQMEKLPDFPIQFVYDFQFNPVLQLCKIFRPSPATTIKVNAACTLNENWSWKTDLRCENIVGTELSLDANEKTVTIMKEWKITPDPDQDVVASIRGCVDLSNSCFHWFIRAGLRVERVAMADDIGGFHFCPQIPLDGKDGNIKFEPKINVDMPKLNVEYTTYRKDHLSFRNSDGFLEIGCKEQIFHFVF